ncbi:MAG: right-handed parallel beta-helix repeat-containing protein [Myxococcaceae bacterium]|nr:right-handed parallel beta-helix repeat-containing protein [Myxococcaceae bacterium]
MNGKWWLWFALAGCTPLRPYQGEPPAGLMCDRILVPAKSLSETLGTAKPGDCVILADGTYSGAFVLPEDVSLAASEGADVTLTGGDPVLTIKGGRRSMVRGLRVVATGANGVSIEPGPAQLVGVKVAQAQKSALTASCMKDCADKEVALTDCEVSQSSTGIRVAGLPLRLERGRVAEQVGTSLSSGSGVVATAGAVVSLKDVVIEQNQNVGVLLDGATTRATLDGCTIRNNQGRGVWAQGQVRTGVEPSVTVTGGEVSGNALVGIGARDASGLVIRQARVLSTKAIRVPIDISRSEDVGDGIGLFTGTSGVTVEGVTLADNARAQVLADQSGQDVRLAGTMSGGRFRVVVQRTGVAVTVEPALLDAPPMELTVRSGTIGLDQ